MNHQDEHEYGYRTSDFGCATALVASGFRLLRLDKSNPRRAVFVFEDGEDLRAKTGAFWSGGLLVDARQFFETSKRLKARIYADNEDEKSGYGRSGR
jgi:Domain of unknown function (DUF5659)